MLQIDDMAQIIGLTPTLSHRRVVADPDGRESTQVTPGLGVRSVAWDWLGVAATLQRAPVAGPAGERPIAPESIFKRSGHGFA